MRISDWSSYVCSSDLHRPRRTGSENVSSSQSLSTPPPKGRREDFRSGGRSLIIPCASRKLFNAFGDMAFLDHQRRQDAHDIVAARHGEQPMLVRSEEHTSELQSLRRISYAVVCLKTKNDKNNFKPLSLT